MADPGRKKKTRIEVTSKWAIGVDLRSYTIEEFSPSQGWRPIKWFSTLPQCCSELLEMGVKASILNMLSAGTSRINEATVNRILSECDENARRLYERVHAAREDGWGL